MNINELLDQAKTQGRFHTDTALAKKLGHTIGDISHWRAGGKYRPNLETSYQLGVLAKLNSPWDAVVIVEREAARKPEKKQFWDDVLKKAAMVSFCGLVILNMTPSPTEAHQFISLDHMPLISMCIM